MRSMQQLLRKSNIHFFCRAFNLAMDMDSLHELPVGESNEHEQSFELVDRLYEQVLEQERLHVDSDTQGSPPCGQNLMAIEERLHADTHRSPPCCQSPIAFDVSAAEISQPQDEHSSELVDRLYEQVLEEERLHDENQADRPTSQSPTLFETRAAGPPQSFSPTHLQPSPPPLGENADGSGSSGNSSAKVGLSKAWAEQLQVAQQVGKEFMEFWTQKGKAKPTLDSSQEQQAAKGPGLGQQQMSMALQFGSVLAACMLQFETAIARLKDSSPANEADSTATGGEQLQQRKQGRGTKQLSALNKSRRYRKQKYRKYRRQEGGETHFLRAARIPGTFLHPSMKMEPPLTYDKLNEAFGDLYFYSDSYPMEPAPPRSAAGWMMKSKRLYHNSRPVETLRGWLKLQLVKIDSFPPTFESFQTAAERDACLLQHRLTRKHTHRRGYSRAATVPYATWRDRQLIYVDDSEDSGQFVRFANKEERDRAHMAEEWPIGSGRTIRPYGSTRVSEARLRQKETALTRLSSSSSDEAATEAGDM